MLEQVQRDNSILTFQFFCVRWLLFFQYNETISQQPRYLNVEFCFFCKSCLVNRVATNNSTAYFTFGKRFNKTFSFTWLLKE